MALAAIMALDKATVARIAALARIRLGEAELEPLAAELSQILDWVEQLTRSTPSGVAPMTSVAAMRLPMREDRVTDGDCREAILENAPQRAGGDRAGFSPCPRWSSDGSSLDRSSLAEARDGLRAEEFSARELTRAHIAAVETARPLNAFITETPERALGDGRRRRRAARPTARRCPLDGIPIAVKDLFCTKGVLTTAASHILDGFAPPYELTVTDKLWAAGAVMLGKTNLDEFAMGSSNTTSYYGPVENPVAPAAGTTGRWCRAARPAARRRRWRRVPRSPRPAPTPAARSASRRAFAASSG